MTEYMRRMSEHPSQYLRRCLDALGVSQAELARRAGVSTKHLSGFMTGRARISADLAVRLEAALYSIAAQKWKAEEWMAAQGRYDVAVARGENGPEETR